MSRYRARARTRTVPPSIPSCPPRPPSPVTNPGAILRLSSSHTRVSLARPYHTPSLPDSLALALFLSPVQPLIRNSLSFSFYLSRSLVHCPPLSLSLSLCASTVLAPGGRDLQGGFFPSRTRKSRHLRPRPRAWWRREIPHPARRPKRQQTVLPSNIVIIVVTFSVRRYNASPVCVS